MTTNVHPYFTEQGPEEGGTVEKVRGDFPTSCDDHIKYQTHALCYITLVCSPTVPTSEENKCTLKHEK